MCLKLVYNISVRMRAATVPLLLLMLELCDYITHEHPKLFAAVKKYLH